MKIRQLYAYELRPAAALVMETYSRMEQPYVANPKEIEDFKRYADEDHLWVESCKNKLFLFGAFDDNDQMCAVGAIDAAGAVTLLYAGLNFQHRGLEAEVLREMEERDYNDTHRAAAPLRAADDAIMIDTSDMDFDASRELLLDVIRGSVSN